MALKAFAFSALVFLTVACRGREANKPQSIQTPIAAAAFSYADQIGWWHGRCLAISNEHVASGTAVTLIVTDTPQVVRAAKIGERVNTGEQCAPLKGARASGNTKPGLAFYALQADSIETSYTGIGIVAPAVTPEIVRGIAQASLSQDQHKNFFTACSTAEGMKFAVWVDKAYAGEPLWSGYYYLDYDTTPTCP